MPIVQRETERERESTRVYLFVCVCVCAWRGVCEVSDWACGWGMNVSLCVRMCVRE